jgi:hypothetical protein
VKRFALIWAVIFFVAGTALGQESRVTVRVNALGESQVFESENPGDTTERSLTNLAYGMGAVHWYLDPVVLMLGTMFITDHNSHLNKDEFDLFVSKDLEQYRTVLSSFSGPFRKVALDGTLIKKIEGKPKIVELENFLKRLGVPEYTREQADQISPEVIAILTNWLGGAQMMARSYEDDFYKRHPDLLPTNIVKYFYNLTLADILEGYSSVSMIYDIMSLDRVIEQLRSSGWLVNLSNFQEAHLSDDPVPLNSSEVSLKSLHQSPKPIGASNAAAFMYSPQENPNLKKCLLAGEPHQPSTYDIEGGPFSQQKLFKALAKLPSGELSQFVLSVYPNLPAFAGIHATENSATAGTAAPTGSSLMFLATTNGRSYLLNGQSIPFSERRITLNRGTGSFEGKIFSMEGFGDVFAWARDPETGSLLALSMRPKSASSLVAGFWKRIIAGLKNDSAGYISALEDGLPLYGEAGCHPSSPGVANKAYFALNQGKVDDVDDELSVTSLGINSVDRTLLKTGVKSQLMCIRQSWTTSDNGPLKHGCENPPPSAPAYIDPGFKTFRQADFISSIQAITGPLNNDDIFRIATSTYSTAVHRTIDLVVLSVEMYGATILPSYLLGKYQQVAADLREYSGFIEDNSRQVLVAYLYQNIFSKIQSAQMKVSPVLREYLSDPAITRDAAQKALTSRDALILIKNLTEALNFHESMCQSRGISKYSSALSINISGQTVASGFAGPGYDSRSSGTFRFKSDDGQNLCDLEMITSSPNKFVYTEDTFFYLPFGPIISELSMMPELYAASNSAWGVLWGDHNKNGQGYGGANSYRPIKLGQLLQSEAQDLPVIKEFVFKVPRLVIDPTPTPTPSLTPTPSPTSTPTPNPTPDQLVKLTEFAQRLNLLVPLVQRLKPYPGDSIPTKRQRILRQEILAELEKIKNVANYISGVILSGQSKISFEDKFKKFKRRTKRVTKAEEPPFKKVKRRVFRSIEKLTDFITQQQRLYRR